MLKAVPAQPGLVRPEAVVRAATPGQALRDQDRALPAEAWVQAARQVEPPTVELTDLEPRPAPKALRRVIARREWAMKPLNRQRPKAWQKTEYLERAPSK
jgi:hypothetical protein